MALSNENSRSFRLYVTHVDGDGHLLRISGQLDHQSSLMLETLFEGARENLEKGIGAVPPGAIHEGVICAAKYKDGTYYRAKVVNTANISTGLIGVHFIDFGNKDIISLSTIRFLDSYDPMFLQLRGQATDYYLSRVINPTGRWEEPVILKLQSLLCYSDYMVTLDVQTPSLPIISIQFKGNDLSQHLVSIRFGMPISIAKQEVLILQMNEKQQAPNWPANFTSEPPPTYAEHSPFMLNQNFPSNPASAMRLQQNSLPFNGNAQANPLINQRLLVNKASRTTANLRAVRQPQQGTPPGVVPMVPPPSTAPPSFGAGKPVSPKKSATYKSRLLEVNSKHSVIISYAEEGPDLFAVQLLQDARNLQEMMDEINRRPHRSLTEPPMIGTVCLGRMSEDRIISRAIVMNLSGSQCKLFFVDFGDTEMVSYYDIFDIPEEFVKPGVFATRFCLSGVKKLEKDKGPQLNEMFKRLVATGDVLTLKVVPPEGPPLIQYGELYIENQNVLDLLMSNTKDMLQFRWLGMLPMGTKHSVLVSYVDSCIKFYVQQSKMIDDLNTVMDAVKVHCENSTSPGVLPVDASCCARFADDGNWYRARVRSVKGDKIIVAYVDYGNEQEVDVKDLRTITPELIRLPAQAMKCALKGFESRPVETKTSNQLEMLALEKTLIANVVGVLSSDTMLVTLIDDTVIPPLDVARKMNQLSQPRSSQEIKATTPVRKDAPESFSSPEGSATDERKKSFRREKSFKDERRVPRDGEEFAQKGGYGATSPDDRRSNSFRREKSFKDDRPRDSNDEFQRGGSFRSRDSRDGFDRSAPGRHSEKFAGKPDRGDRNDRRGGPKPWENNNTQQSAQAAALPADDDWDESPANNNATHRNNRDQRDRRKAREQGNRPASGWKKDSGVGKRLKQAAEAASSDAQGPRASVQDRLRRDRFNPQEEREERSRDEWSSRGGGRSERGNTRGRGNGNWTERPPRRDFGNKDYGNKDFGNRDYGNRDSNRGSRGGRGGSTRGRGGFSPRNRDERSFDDTQSERSQRSDRSDRSRKRTKEIADPVSLDTPFGEPEVQTGAQCEVAVTWIVSPESFYTQILSLQPRFLEMMHSIPELYKGVRPYAGTISVGASVLAKYPADGVLYRATVVSAQPFSKFIVKYVDFGNKQLVDARDIWQLDSKLLELPRMAVHCSLIGVAPKDSEWKADPAIDLCFNAPRYQCVFQELEEDKYKVSLWNNGVSVADMLVEKELAATSGHQSSVTLKDEPIDMTIIVGQQILCRVTHVDSFEKIYVQLDIEKAALVEETIANFDVTKLTKPAPEMISEGAHCTLKHDNKICRAILLDVADTNNIKAVLPDYGNEITTSVDNIMILPTELSVYYYQSLHCSFNNYTAESKTLMTIDELRAKLTGNKFIIYINDVDGIVLVSTLYDPATGGKISIFEPDPGAYDEVVPLCMRAVFNYNFGLAYISHAETLNEFYLQKSTDGDRLADLLNELFKFYEEGTPEPLTEFEVESLCAAHSSDGNWYRATVVSLDNEQVKVHFTDYGNSETLPKDSLRKLDPKFFEPCALALVTSLGLVALRDDALEKLTEWTTEKEVQVTLSFGSDGWLASLHLDGVDLSMKLIEEKLATPQIAEEPKEREVAQEESPGVAAPEGCIRVYISHIDTPGHFWLQALDKVDKIEEIQAELQAAADSYPELEARETGTLCVAKYLADDRWYRAEILDADSDITTVRFVDYGNTDVLDNRPGLIKALPEGLRVEGYAMRSGVNAVPTGTGEWSEAATDLFAALVGDLSAPLDALVVLKDVTTYVDLYAGGRDVTDRLVAAGHAAREQPDCGPLPSCFASHVNSPSEFWIQLEAAAPELQAMEAAMVDAELFPPLAEREEGVVCAAKYPEDGAWYRAQVVVDGSEGTEVLFMDYGNASIADELRSLPDPLKGKPALSRKCALQKPRDVKAWSRKSELRFNELAAEGATVFAVQFIASGDISIVELYLDGKSVTEELVALCEERPPERPPPLGREPYADAKVSFVQAADEFYVHLAEALPRVDRVTEALAGAPDFDSAAELKVGALCAALWPEDERWYRARILEFCDVGYHVQFVDYGNKAKCDDFRKLPEEIAAIEPLAECCRLAGVTDDPALAECAKNKLDELALENVTFRIEYLDSAREPTLVKVIVDGSDLISLLAAGPATETLDRATERTDSKTVESDLPHSEKPAEGEPRENTVEVEKKEIDTEDNKPEERKETAEEPTEVKDADAEQGITDAVDDRFDDAVDDEAEEQDDGQVDLNESIDSAKTVIEIDVEGEQSPADEGLNSTASTLDNSVEAVLPSREESKDSLNTDTGYTSSGDQDKSSEHTDSPKKEQPDEPTKDTEKNGEIANKETSTLKTDSIESPVDAKGDS